MAQRRSGKGGRRADYQENEYLTEDLTPKERQRYASRRKRRRRGLVPMPIVLLLFVAAIAALGGRFLLQRYAPSKEQKDLNEWFEVSGSTVRIYLNDEMNREVFGVAENGEVYLPIDYVNSALNKRFFWNADEGLLCYTLPEETLHFTEESRNADGNAVFLLREDGMYLSVGTLLLHTDMRANRFASAEDAAKRIFIYKDQGEVQTGEVKRDTQLRTKGGIKAPILTELPKGSRVTVLEQMENWARVSTEDGFVGYMQEKRLSDLRQETFESGFAEPEVKRHMLSEKVVLAWHQVAGRAGNATFDAYVENTGGIMNVICPTWIQIKNAAGEYDNFSTQDYMDKAHAAGLQVWVTVDNFNNTTAFKEFSTKTYFANSENRADFIARLMADAETYGYDGFNLDFESLPTDAGPSYAQFYRELSVACRAAGLTLSIDNYVPYGFNSHYDLEEQGVFADYVIIMGYDEHTSGSEEAGSVASIGFTRYGIEETLKQVPAAQVINAVPFYTRIWKEAGPSLSSDAMGITQAKAYVEDNNIELKWDEESGQYYGELQLASGLRRVWMEEERSIAEKVALIREYNLGGVGAWRLGFEPAEIWKELDLNGKGR